MPENEVTQIRIDKNMVGIIGLEQAMNAMALVFAHRSDDEIGNEILKRVSEKNYIPSRAKELYAKAFVREFRKFLGQSVEETTFEGLRVVVLGPGCANCERLYRNTERAVKELGLDCRLEKITDLHVIMGYRILSTPGLVVDGKVQFSGRVPSVDQLKEILS